MSTLTAAPKLKVSIRVGKKGRLMYFERDCLSMSPDYHDITTISSITGKMFSASNCRWSVETGQTGENRNNHWLPVACAELHQHIQPAPGLLLPFCSGNGTLEFDKWSIL